MKLVVKGKLAQEAKAANKHNKKINKMKINKKMVGHVKYAHSKMHGINKYVLCVNRLLRSILKLLKQK